MFQYQKVAQDLRQLIEQNYYSAGDKLPGVREMSRQRDVSVVTVVSAYRILEDEGYLDARPKSGYFVRNRPNIERIGKIDVKKENMPCSVTGQELVLAMTKAATDPHCIKLGSAVPGSFYLPSREVEKALRDASKRRDKILTYCLPGGEPELKNQIARRMVDTGYVGSPEDIIITNGCQEALTVALKATTQPGDLVAIESPTFYGLLQVIDLLGLKAIEVETDPEQGMCPISLKRSLEKWDVKACLVTPNFHNPYGFLMTDERKNQLVDVAEEFQIPIIEDDTYGDLSFDNKRPSSLIGLRPSADIIYCSTYSKTISPDLRVGWMVSSRRTTKLDYLKFAMNLTAPSVTQLATASILGSGKYEKYLRRVRSEYSVAINRALGAIEQNLKGIVKVSNPKGGFLLWLEFPEHVDCVEIAGLALKKGISIAPGIVFSPSAQHRNYMRISCAGVLESKLEETIRTLSGVIKNHLKNKSAQRSSVNIEIG